MTINNVVAVLNKRHSKKKTKIDPCRAPLSEN